MRSGLLVGVAVVLATGCGPPRVSTASVVGSPHAPQRRALALTSMPSRRTVPMSRLRGHTSIVEFWATWCGPCREALPAYADIAARYDPATVTLVPVSVDDDATAVAPFLRELGLDVPALVDADGSARIAFSVDEIPTTIVLDERGQVHLRYAGWRSETPLAVSDWLSAHAR